MTGAPTVLVLASDRPVARAIRWATRGPASHVAIGLGAGVLHAQGHGVMLETRSALEGDGYKRLAEYLVLRDVRPGLTHALSQHGKPYDVGDLLGWLVRPRRRRMLLDGNRPRWTCVRLVLALDPDRTRIPEWASLDPGLTTPTDLWRSMEGATSFHRLA